MAKNQIVLVGEQLLPIYLGIKEFVPDEVHFIATNESKPKAQLLLALLGKKKSHWHTCSAYDFESILSACNDAIKQSSGAQILFNLTGGTKIMVLAAQRSMLESGSQGFYIIQNDEALLLPEFKAQSLKATITVDEFITLSNHEGKYISYLSVPDNDLQAARLIHDFVQKHPLSYKRIIEGHTRMKFNKSGALTLNSNLSTSWTTQKFTITHGNNLLDINTPNYKDVLFKGGWWELVVAQQFISWPKIKEIAINCVLKFQTDKKIHKNEIDILLNLGRKLVFIECKSGDVTTKDIDRMKVIKNTYGDTFSKSVLVTYEKPSNTVLKICEEGGIGVFHLIEKGGTTNPFKKLIDLLDKMLVS